MKGRYFLVVLCAVVCTVWSEIEWQGCSNTELSKCHDFLQVFKDSRNIQFLETRERLDLLCTNMNRQRQCMESYVQRCGTEEDLQYFHSWSESRKQLYMNLCDHGKNQEEFLVHVSCLGQVRDDCEHFYHQHEQKIGELKAILKDGDGRPTKETRARIDSAQRKLCCSQRDYIDCIKRRVMEKCEEKSAEYIEEFLMKTNHTIIQDNCKSYQCQDSSASRNFQRALLLPVSLAMLSLYALRST